MTKTKKPEIVRQVWLGPHTPHFYPATGGIYTHGDVVDVPHEIVERDPDRWGDVPTEGDGQAQKGPDA